MPLDNFSLVEQRENGARLFRSAQPDPDAFATAISLGVSKIYNVREQCPRQCNATIECDCVVWPVSTFRTDATDVAALVGFIDADLQSGKSALVHCQWGRDRTGCVIAAYRLMVNKWSLEAALAERALFGTNPLVDVADTAILDVLRTIAAGQRT